MNQAIETIRIRSEPEFGGPMVRSIQRRHLS